MSRVSFETEELSFDPAGGQEGTPLKTESDRSMIIHDLTGDERSTLFPITVQSDTDAELVTTQLINL